MAAFYVKAYWHDGKGQVKKECYQYESEAEARRAARAFSNSKTFIELCQGRKVIETFRK